MCIKFKNYLIDTFGVLDLQRIFCIFQEQIKHEKHTLNAPIKKKCLEYVPLMMLLGYIGINDSNFCKGSTLGLENVFQRQMELKNQAK